jgi:transcriptional regulator with XRE-family HTH domain
MPCTRRPTDTFSFPPELGKRLRDLRLRAGLTQAELAQAMGRAGKGRACIVSRMEKGKVRYPSLGLVADFLRGCRAGFADILDILDLYTDLPTTQQQVFSKALARVAASVPAKWQSQVTKYDQRIDIPKSAASEAKSPPKPDRMKRLERARRNAAAVRRRVLYGVFLKVVIGRPSPYNAMAYATPLFNHGLEWFAILYDTRGRRPATREKQLAECEDKLARTGLLPLEVIRHLQDEVKEHFDEMERRGDLDWLPDLSLDEYEASLLKPASKRELREAQRREMSYKIGEYTAACRALTEQVWQEVQPFLDEAGVAKERRAIWRPLAGYCFTAALNSEPGSERERRQLDECILEPRRIRLGLDTALARKLAAIILPRFRELAKTLPPDPRPKR